MHRFGALGQKPQVQLVAGTGASGYGGDGGPARLALLNEASGVAVDAAGNVYIADNENHRIRKVSPDGIMTTFAGTGEAGDSGDGGPARLARLREPYGVQVDAHGNVYIADADNHRIRKVTPDGIITTVAGNGRNGFSGDGGPATEAALAHPDDVAVDAAGNVYIADAGNDRIRKVTPDGIITTVAGNGKRRYNGESGYMGDGGPAVEARLDTPASLALDRDGNLYLGDLRNHAVRRISPDGIIATVAGTGRAGYNGDGFPAVRAWLNEPGGVAVAPDGSLIVADGANFRIRRVAPDGRIATIAGTGRRGNEGHDGPAREAAFGILDLLRMDDRGRIYFTDYGNSRVCRLVPLDTPAPEPAEAEALLERMRRAYADLRSAEADFTFRRVRDGEAITFTGTLAFAAPGKLRVELESPAYGHIMVVSDGYKITTLDPDLSVSDVRPYTDRTLSRMVPANLETMALYEWERQLSTDIGGFMQGSALHVERETRDGHAWIVLVETTPALEIRYSVEPETYLIRRTLQRDARTHIVLYEGQLTRLILNVPVDERWFNAPGR